MSRSTGFQSNLENEKLGELSCEVGINEQAERTLCLILSHLPAKQIINNRRVCKKWRQVVDGKSLWFDKFEHDFKELPQSVKKLRLLDIRKIFIHNIIGRNLLPELRMEILRPHGLFTLKDPWALHQSTNGFVKLSKQDGSWPGYRPGPVPRCDPSWSCNMKSGCVGVVVDLWEKGISKEFMDTVKPWISFSGYHAVISHEGFMTIQIKLVRNVDLFWICQKSSLDAFHPTIPSVTKKSHVWEMPPTNGKYYTASSTIKDYPDDIRYVYIYVIGSSDYLRTNRIGLGNYEVVAPCLKLSIPKET